MTGSTLMTISTTAHWKDERSTKWIALIISFLLTALTLLLLASKVRRQIVERLDEGHNTNAARIRKLTERIRKGVNARGFYITGSQEDKLMWGESSQPGTRLTHVRAFAKENGWQVDARESS